MAGQTEPAHGSRRVPSTGLSRQVVCGANLNVKLRDLAARTVDTGEVPVGPTGGRAADAAVFCRAATVSRRRHRRRRQAQRSSVRFGRGKRAPTGGLDAVPPTNETGIRSVSSTAVRRGNRAPTGHARIEQAWRGRTRAELFGARARRGNRAPTG
jgi:hypothetical protein